MNLTAAARSCNSFFLFIPAVFALSCANSVRSYDLAAFAAPIPELPGPLCTELAASGLDEDECAARRAVFVLRAMQATVRVLPPTGGSDAAQIVGTGVMIDSDGSCLTANHVVAGSDYALVAFRAGADADDGIQFRDAGSAMMKVVHRDTAHDLALLRPLEPTRHALVPVLAEIGLANDFGYGSIVWHFGTTTLARAGKVYAVDHETLESGLKDIVPLYGLDAATAEGDSGAPVFAGNGKLVGILIGGAVPGEKTGQYQHALFVPIDAARGILSAGTLASERRASPE